jgi:hypothetical protein
MSNIENNMYLEESRDVIKNDCASFGGVYSEPAIYNQDAAHKKKLTEYFEALTREEMELFIDIVPIDLCMGRIQKELDKSSEFEKAIKTVVNGVM